MASSDKRRLKDIHLASGLWELNKLAYSGLPADTNANPSLYIKSADKVFLKAKDYDLEGDEEYAFVFYKRYMNIIFLIKNSTKYSDNKKYYDNLIGKSKDVLSLVRAATLLISLGDRYHKLRAQKEVGKKVPEEAKGKEEEDKTISFPDPIAFYPLNSKYGTREIENRQLQGTPVGVSLAAGPDGKAGGSYQFAGRANSYIEFQSNGGLDAKRSITMLCWVYPENPVSGPLFNYKTNCLGIHVWLFFPGMLCVRFMCRNYKGQSHMSTSRPLELNQWHYVGATYDYNTGIASLWLDGRQVVCEDIGASLTLATQDYVRMGAGGDFVLWHFKGRITAMQVYDVALTAEQINALKSAGQESQQRTTDIGECNREIVETIEKQGNSPSSGADKITESRQGRGHPGEINRKLPEEKIKKQGNDLSSSTDKLSGAQQRIRYPGQNNREFEEIQTQENNLSCSTDRSTDPQQRIKELEHRNVELKQKNAEFKEKMGDQANKLSSSTEKLTGVQKKIHELEQRNKELEEKVQEQANKHKWSQQKIRELEQRNVKLEEKLQQQEDNHKHATELDRYAMGEGPRGICLVINNVNFLGEDERRGSEIDEKDITVLFSEELHFKVEIRRNLDGYGILKTAQEFAANDHSKYTAFVFIIMSHGDQKDVIYGVDGRKARVEDIMSEFTATKCPMLENKPKMFFIQACRGQASDPRMSRLAPADNTEDDSIATMLSPDSKIANGVSPQEADFLLAFATVPGYKSWRSKQAGSWFVQVLVNVIRRYHRHHHLIDMLTVVNKEVADIANDNPDVGLSFQVPAPTHTLRAQVFL